IRFICSKIIYCSKRYLSLNLHAILIKNTGFQSTAYFCTNIILFSFMHIHFIAIGGAIMHQLAITLHKKGERITGSDDEITDPARSNLATYHLLPEAYGWFPEK